MDELKIASTVIQDRPVGGFSSSIEAASDLGDTELASRLSEVAARLGTGMPGDQSAAGDLLRKIVSRVRGRKLVEDYGVHAVEVPWLCLHVPPSGSAQLQLSDSQKDAGGIKFSLAGTGLGDGWTVQAKLKRDFQERKRCMTLVEAFQVRVRGYAYGEAPADIEIRSDVVEHVGTSARELARCPLCEPRPEDEPVLANKAGPAIDLTADPVGQKMSQVIELGGTSELEVGLKATLAGVGVSAGVTCKREVSLTCSLDYVLPGGRRYLPMRRLEYLDLPFWRVG